MKTMKSPHACVLAFCLSALLCNPNQIMPSPDTPQRAGEVSRVIPAVSIARGAKSISASAKTVVDWQDVVSTQASARARVALDDGSVLNVGSDSSIKVVKHDGGAQQTELELTFGKIRSQAQKITKPDGKFEVKTPAGVAGVVGTDFFVAFDNSTGTMNVIVFEGLVKVWCGDHSGNSGCNSGNCDSDCGHAREQQQTANHWPGLSQGCSGLYRAVIILKLRSLHDLRSPQAASVIGYRLSRSYRVSEIAASGRAKAT